MAAVICHDTFAAGPSSRTDGTDLAETQADTVGANPTWTNPFSNLASGFVGTYGGTPPSYARVSNNNFNRGTVYTADCSPALSATDYDVEITLSAIDTSADDGIILIFRWQDIENFFSVGITGAATNHYFLCKRVGGISTKIEESTSIPGATDVFRVEVRGDAIQVYRNGIAELASYTSTDLNTQFGVGIGWGEVTRGCYKDWDATIDNQITEFKVTDQDVVAGTNPKGPFNNPFAGPFGGPI